MSSRNYTEEQRAAARARAAARRARDPAGCRAAIVAWERRNPERVRAIKQAWVERNREQHRAACRRVKQNNPAGVAADNVRHRTKRVNSTPSWSNKFFVAEAYDLAKRRTVLTGFSWQVDHIVPLRSPLVSGLHAHTNVAVIPKSVNLAKGNRSWPDMP